MDNLKFRRQFLLSPKKCEELNNWKQEEFGANFLYVHPDCGVTMVHAPSMQIALIGYIIDPSHPQKSDKDIVDDIAGSDTINSIYRKLYNYGGRFVLAIRRAGEQLIFHDPCGLKSVFYTKFENEIYIASQPLLFKLLMPLKEGLKYQSFYKSAYVKRDIENWIPSGSSLYDNVYHLVPNHYFTFSTFTQTRYWPYKQHAPLSFEDGVKKASALLNKIMSAADQRFKLALPLTAGLDSRTILSACKPIANDIFFYTLQYKNLTDKSTDIRVPGQVLAAMGYQHHVIDCRKSMDKAFSESYLQNTDIPHLDNWGMMAYGMFTDYPPGRIAIKGSCAEIGRCFYYSSGTHADISSAADLEVLEKWKDITFIKERLSEWLTEIKDPKVNKGYDLLDLFYWEHRMGSWQSQNQLEWGIIHEVFTPFNNRALLDIILAVDPLYRCEPDYLLFRAIIKELWSEILRVPINPKSGMKKFNYASKRLLKRIGVFFILKKIFRNVKKNAYQVRHKLLTKH